MSKDNTSSDIESEPDVMTTNDAVGNGGEKLQPVGFWDARIAHVRREVMFKWLLTTVVLMTLILSILSIYWGSVSHIAKNISALSVYVVDFDAQPPYNTHTPIVGPTIASLVQNMNLTEGHLGYINAPPSMFNNDPIEVRQAVYDFKAWAAVIINPNATSMLYSAINNGNSSYEPLGACQLVYMDSRDDSNWYDYIGPQLNIIMSEATAKVGAIWTNQTLQAAKQNSSIMSNLEQVPQALNPAIGFSIYNLRPFVPLQAIPAVSVGLIYLIIVSFFGYTFFIPVHMIFLTPGGNRPPLKFRQQIIWRWVTTMIGYFFLSLAYSLISLAFQINFSGGNPVTSHTEVTNSSYGNPDGYGKATFMVYWMLNYVGMIALGLASENMAMMVGLPWMGMWLIFWVITNVSTSFYDVALEPGFYRWGYAFPLHNIVEGSRSILFDLHSRLGINFGVLFAWAAINTAFFPICCWFMRWKIRNNKKVYWA